MCFIAHCYVKFPCDLNWVFHFSWSHDGLQTLFPVFLKAHSVRCPQMILSLLHVSAVLFWLNYKAAYDNWKEQRLALNSDIHMATKEVVDKLPAIQQSSVQAFSTLFLQLTVNDLGICLPITSATPVNQRLGQLFMQVLFPKWKLLLLICSFNLLSFRQITVWILTLVQHWYWL